MNRDNFLYNNKNLVNKYNVKNQNSHLCSGFTLLEVMIAVTIIAVVITAIWGLHSKTVLLNIHAQFYTQAPFLAEERMAQLLGSISDHTDVEQGDFGEDFVGYAWKSSVTDVESETLGSMAEKMKKIEVTVTFGEGEFEYILTTFRLLQE